MTDRPLDGLHAVGYCRVSTDDKGQDTDIQEQEIRKWAQAQGVIIDAVMSEDISGAVWPRPKLSEAIITVATTQASILVCYDPSRLTRDAEGQLGLIKGLLGTGKTIRYVTNGDLDPDSLGARMMTAIKGVTDSEERKVLKEKTTLALHYRRDVLGVHVGRPAKVIITDTPNKYDNGKIARGQEDGKKTTTIIVTPTQLTNWARNGWKPSYVAVHILQVSPQLFLQVLKKSPYLEDYYKTLKETRGCA